MNRRAAVGVAAGVLVAVLVVLGVREAGSVVRRPEGAAERFISAASRRSAKDRAQAADFGTRDVARTFSNFPREKTDDDYLSQIEVGRASARHGTVRVPFRVHRNIAKGLPDRVSGVLVVAEHPGPTPQRWRVLALEPCCQGVRLPAHGSAPASVGTRVWLLAVGLGAAFTVGCEVLLRALGARPRPRPSSKR